MINRLKTCFVLQLHILPRTAPVARLLHLPRPPAMWHAEATPLNRSLAAPVMGTGHVPLDSLQDYG